MLDDSRDPPAGTSIVAAFRDFVLHRRGALASDDPAAIHRVATTARIIAASMALQTREQQIIDQTTRGLAELVAADLHSTGLDPASPGGRVLPYVIANALMGVNRATIHEIQRLAMAGVAGSTWPTMCSPRPGTHSTCLSQRSVVWVPLPSE